LHRNSIRLVSLADEASPEWYMWGLVGIYPCHVYWDHAHQIHKHLGMMRDSLEDRVLALAETGSNYAATEDQNSTSFKSLGELDPGPVFQPTSTDSNNDSNGPLIWGVSGHDILRFDWKSDIPLVSTVLTTGYSLGQNISDGEWPDIWALADSAADITGNVLLFALDPFNYLICAGLTFLVDVVQPLEDLLGLVTGNPERMDEEISKWQTVLDELGPTSEQIRQAANSGLLSWKGDTAEAAKTRLSAFADGVASLANHIDQLIAIMKIAKAIMEAAQAFVIALIATFIEWLVFTWTAAIATAEVTLGASTVTATAATELKIVGVLERGVRFVDRIVLLLERIADIMAKIMPKAMEEAAKGFRIQPGWAASSVAPAFRSVGAKFLETGLTPQTWTTGAGKTASGANRHAWKLSEQTYSDQQTSDLLDENS
jgi:hypothetical protein